MKFEDVINKEVGSLRTLAAFLLPNANAVDDVVQMTILRAYDQWSGFDVDKQPGPWLRTILRFMIKTEIRKRFRETENKEKFQNEWFKIISSEDKEEDVDENIHDFLTDCKNELAPKSKELIILKYEDNESCSFISEKMQTSLSWVTTTLSRTRLQLKKCIERKRGGKND